MKAHVNVIQMQVTWNMRQLAYVYKPRGFMRPLCVYVCVCVCVCVCNYRATILNHYTLWVEVRQSSMTTKSESETTLEDNYHINCILLEFLPSFLTLRPPSFFSSCLPSSLPSFLIPPSILQYRTVTAACLPLDD